jgi:hypothetical protein
LDTPHQLACMVALMILSYYEHNERRASARPVIEVPIIECEGMMVTEQRITHNEYAELVRKTYGVYPSTPREAE